MPYVAVFYIQQRIIHRLMILSMTGFGRGQASSGKKKITVEIKSLNSKQMDLSLRIPSYFRDVELTMRNHIAESLHRGKVDATVAFEDLSGEVTTSINVAVVKKYKDQLMAMATELSIAWPSDWYATLLRMPDALHTETPDMDETDAAALTQACDRALGNIIEFRRQEGAKLEKFFRAKVDNIEELLHKVSPFEQSRVERIRHKLGDELQKLPGIEYDKNRLEQELIFYIEKLDVTEEKTRLQAHLNYFRETLDCESSQGKKLGFIAQEMGREINTLGSKSNNADMQRIVVMMKDELEQIKEQVLNVL